MPRSRYEILSMLSGCLWGGIAYYIGHRMESFILGGIIASPFIGLFIGRLLKENLQSNGLFLIMHSLCALYVAAILFGLTCGIVDALSNITPDRIMGAVIIQAVLVTLWGTTMSIIYLGPLSFLNHFALKKYALSYEDDN